MEKRAMALPYLTYPSRPKFRVIQAKGQLNSEWINEVITSPEMQTQNYNDFCPTKQTKDRSTFFVEFLVSVQVFFDYDPCLFGRAEILVIFG